MKICQFNRTDSTTVYRKIRIDYFMTESLTIKSEHIKLQKSY